MSFDGIMTRAMVEECQALVSGRISKIYQPSETEVTFVIREHRNNHTLLLSSHPVFTRIQCTDRSWDNPKEPPMFCRILRKHLDGGVIEQIRQVEMERIIHIDVSAKNDWGDRVSRRLVIELMGRHSNLILVDPETGKVYDSIRRIPLSVSSYRQVFPGSQYKSPPDQGKHNPLHIDKKSFIAGFDYNGGRLQQQIVQRFMGISPQVAQEITALAGLGQREQLWEAFRTVMNSIEQHQYQSTIITEPSGKQYFAAIPLTHLMGTRQTFSTLSQCLDSFYSGKVERDRIRQQAGDLLRRIHNEIEKNKKKRLILDKEQQKSAKADQWRIYGELLTAHMYEVQKGAKEVTVTNYFDPEATLVTIPLDPATSPQKNAQRFFKKYNKLKESRKWNQEQREKALLEIKYLETVLLEMEQANLHELEQIREELIEEGYLKKQTKQKQHKKKANPLPLQVSATDGTKIWIGKNNKQNDYLTHQLASNQHIWLHTKEIPGSHVVIQTHAPTDDTLLEAAMLAAYFSKAQASSQVPVDYTLIKHVKKPNGSRPGYVTYDQQQTIYVTPEVKAVERLIKQ